MHGLSKSLILSIHELVRSRTWLCKASVRLPDQYPGQMQRTLKIHLNLPIFFILLEM